MCAKVTTDAHVTTFSKVMFHKAHDCTFSLATEDSFQQSTAVD